MRIIFFIYLFVLSFITAFSQGTEASFKEDQFIDDLISKMTIEEKIGQMTQYTGFFDITGPAPESGDNKRKYDDIKNGLVGSMLNVKGAEQVREMQKLAVENSRLGIPMIFGYDVIHGYKTISPIPLAEAASWDLEAIQQSARVAATEATAAGLNWTFAPMVDISRDARWGRVMEGAGEDPYLGSRIAAARVQGFQGSDLTASNTLAACTKHFAAYGFVESGKDYNTADIGTSTLYNVVLPPFKATVDAGVMTFMNSFNELNGIPATADKFLQRNILKGDWGFDGFVVSDWGSIDELVIHGYAEDAEYAAQYAAIAGSDMDMESHAYKEHLQSLIEENRVDVSVIDEAASRILRVKYRLGLFDDPYRYCNEAREKELTMSKENRDASLEMAKKSIVLLKNDQDILPLPKSGKKIAVIGHLADSESSPLGNWILAADDNSAVSLLEGTSNYSGNEYSYTQGVRLYEGREKFIYELKINTEDRSGIEQAVALAKESDIVIMNLGEHGFMSGEARSRATLGLPGLQQELLEAVHEVNPNVVLVLQTGRPLTITWADDHVPAIINAWQLGTESGHAIAQVLFGDYNPSGKLPMTFPRSVGQVPIFYNHKNTGRPYDADLVFWSHYIDQTNAPLYPFGYGLSYTAFEYKNLSVVSSQNTVDVSVTVTNTGDYDGEEIVQLYIRDHHASIVRPIKELKGFEKVSFKKGETKTVKFQLTEKELGYFDNQGKYTFEPGKFSIMVGGNSADLIEQVIEL